MKTFLRLLVILFLITGIAVPAWGDLFTTTTAITITQFQIEGAAAPFNYGVSGQLLSVSLDGEADLGVRPGVGLSYGSVNGSDLTIINPRIDWGFQFFDYTFRISEVYQMFVFRPNDTVPASYSYAGFSMGITGQWKISEMLTINGTVFFPQTGGFYRDSQNLSNDDPVAHSYNYGLKITVLPIISFSLNRFYNGIGDGDSPFQLENQGTYFGAIYRW